MPGAPGERSVIVGYYAGEVPDVEGRMIDDVWSWGDDRLEYVHDYIQWLFPLSERSMANPRAPLLTDGDVAAFRGSDRLRARLLTSFHLMLRFYGLRTGRVPESAVVVEEGPDFEVRHRLWVRSYNHNHLRLTRILISMNTLGLDDEARALQRFLLDLAAQHPEAISDETMRYWQSAIAR